MIALERRILLVLCLITSVAAHAQTNVVTQHNDIGRTGRNLTESILTPAVVSSGNFGKLYSVNLDGRAFAQPLYLSSVTIGGAKHRVVYVATTHDSVYALDANASGAVLWKASLLDAAHGAAAGAIPDPESDTGCGDVDNSEYGVMGTPVIDPVSSTLYVVSLTSEGNYPVQRLHSLDATTGAEKTGSPITIGGSVAGTGSGSSNGSIAFDPKWLNQRAGLLLVNGVVYIGWGSHCDSGPWHGWVLGYDAKTLQKSFSFMATPNGSSGGVWLSGLGLAADVAVGTNGTSTTRMFTATGNGSFDTNGDWSESVLDLNLSSGAANPVTDSFTPSTQAQLTNDDEDLGAAGPILLPDEAGSTLHPHLAVQLSKAGTMYLLDRDKLGGYHATGDQNVQDVTFGAYSYGIWGGPAYFNSNLYFWAANGNMQQYSLSNGLLSTAPVATNAINEPGTGGGYYNGTFLGATPSISANGASNGIVWVDDTVRDQGNPIQYLYAFDASNVANLLWSSRQNPARDGAGGSQKFAVPTIADGNVFLAGQNSLNVYGILPPGFTLNTTPAAVTVEPGTSVSIQLTVAPVGGFTGAVVFSIANLPAGVTGAVASASNVLTLTAASTAAVTASPVSVVVTGTSGSLTRSVSILLSVATSVQPVSVNILGSSNTFASANAGTANNNGGLDNAGYSYNGALLGSSISALGVTFSLGTIGVADAVSSTILSLSTGSFAKLNLLATGLNGNQPNQTFVVNYSDGSSSTFTQSLSDWGSPQNYTGETVALSMANRITPSGATQTGPWCVYAYSFALNTSKIVASVTLPLNRNVVVLAVTLSGEVEAITTVTSPPPATSIGPAISLNASANVYASFTDGAAPQSGGLDGVDYAYSAKLLGSAVTWSGVTYPIGTSGTANAVSSATIALAAGQYAAINLLATGIGTNQPNQTFVVTYSDGTTSSFVQSVSDWGSPQSYTGETIALGMAYRVTPSGTTQNGPWNLYGYSFALNSAKSVKSLTLPNNRGVVVLGIALRGPTVSLSSVANVHVSANDGTAPSNGGLDNAGYAYSANQLGSSLVWSGTPFQFGAVTAANGLAGGTLPLPAGYYSGLKFLATGVNGNQPNQTFIVTYTDGTSSSFVQSVSDWGSPQGYTGETKALQMPYRIMPNGKNQTSPWYLYGYSFVLNSGKILQSITLPNSRSVVMVAVAVTGP